MTFCWVPSTAGHIYGIKDRKVPQEVVNQINWRHFTVLDIGTMCRDVSLGGWIHRRSGVWVISPGCLRSGQNSALAYWPGGVAGGPFQPFAIRLCAWDCCLGHRFFKCSLKECLCGFDPLVSPVQLSHIVIDSKSSAPKICQPVFFKRVVFQEISCLSSLKKNHNLNRLHLHG